MDAPAHWMEWFTGDKANRRERDRALPAEPGTRGPLDLFRT